MPQMKKMSTPPPEPPKKRNSGIVGRTGFNSQVKKDPAARKRPITAGIYGDELLKPIKKEKEVVICFYPFTANNLRLSTDGRFIIERFSIIESSEEDGQTLIPNTYFNLFYFMEQITDFVVPASENDFKNISYEIKTENYQKFGPFSSALDLTNKAVEVVRDLFFVERQKALEELRERERLEREKEDESEGSSESENNEVQSEKKEEGEVLSKDKEENAGENLQEVEGT